VRWASNLGNQNRERDADMRRTSQGLGGPIIQGRGKLRERGGQEQSIMSHTGESMSGMTRGNKNPKKGLYLKKGGGPEGRKGGTCMLRKYKRP